MQVTVETGEGLVRVMRVELPPDDVEQEIDKRLREVARNARMAGFRPGKVPKRVLLQRYGDSVRGEVVGEMVQSSFPDAVVKEGLRLAGMPEIEAEIDQRARRYAYTAKFEVLPQIEITNLAGKRIKRPVVELSEIDVDGIVARLRDQRKTWRVVDRPAAIGDRVTVSFAGTIDGEAFPGSSAEHQPLELGSGTLWRGFDDQLIGAVAGTERVVEIRLPDSFPINDLAGKQARFDVKVTDVAEPVLPEVDADFIRSFGVEDGDMDRFHAALRENLQREVDQRVKARLKQQVLRALVEANPIDVPTVLVAEEIKAQTAKMGQAAGGGTLDLPGERWTDQAKDRVALRLIVGELVQSRGLKADPARVRAIVEAMAASYEKPAEVIEHYYSDPQRLALVEGLVLEDLVVEFLLEDAEVQDEPISVAELIETPRGA